MTGRTGRNGRHGTGAAATRLTGPVRWAHLLPIGRVSTRPHDVRASWFARDAGAIVAATRAVGLPLPIDYEHQTDHAAANGKPAPAAGWITEIEARPDGIFGRVEWTARASAMLAAGEYRYLSPVFQFDTKSREVTHILRAGLTNDPALFVDPIARAASDDVSAGELAVCAAVGVSPGEYAAARAALLGGDQVPDNGLSDTQRAICAALDVSPEEFARSRASLAEREGE